MDDLQELLNREAIKQLKARYFRMLDTKDWVEYRKLFTDDCRFDRTTVVGDGPDAFVAAMTRTLAEAVTVHHGHQPEIVLLSTTTARALWPMYDYVRWSSPEAMPEKLRVAPDQNGLAGHGHYEEAYRKDDGVWRISRFAVTRLAVVPLLDERMEQTTALTGKWPTVTPDWLPAGWRAA